MGEQVNSQGMRVSVISKLLDFKDDIVVRVRLAHVQVEVCVSSRGARAMSEMLEVQLSGRMRCVSFSKIPHFTAISSRICMSQDLKRWTPLASK